MGGCHSFEIFLKECLFLRLMGGLDLDYLADRYAGLVGKSRLMHERVFKKIDEVSPLDVTVLILGETGVGKELTANAIHQHSARKKSKLVPVNCAAIPDNLLESELYGHVRAHLRELFLPEKGHLRKPMAEHCIWMRLEACRLSSNLSC